MLYELKMFEWISNSQAGSGYTVMETEQLNKSCCDLFEKKFLL